MLHAAACGLLDDDCNLSLSEVAAEVGCQPRTLERVLKDRGTTFREQRDRRRMRRAASVLFGGAEVRDAANASGFAHQRHFATAFRRAYGIPPSRVRTAGLLADRIRRRIASPQASPETKAYARSRRALRKERGRLRQLLFDIPAESGLTAEIEAVLLLRRPDFRTREARDDPRRRKRLSP